MASQPTEETLRLWCQRTSIKGDSKLSETVSAGDSFACLFSWSNILRLHPNLTFLNEPMKKVLDTPSRWVFQDRLNKKKQFFF